MQDELVGVPQRVCVSPRVCPECATANRLQCVNEVMVRDLALSVFTLSPRTALEEAVGN